MSAPFGRSVWTDGAEPVNPAIAAYLGKVALAANAPSKRPILHIDYETYSEVNLPKAGASRYARDPSTEVLMLAYGYSADDIRQWVPDPSLRGQALIDSMPDDLRAAFADPSVTLAAWNAPFEMAITRHTLGLDIPTERWMDVMVLAYSMSLPGKLEKCGEVIGLKDEQRKMQRGKLLVRKFTQPRKPTKNKPWTRCTPETDPDDWDEFLEYNRRDVVAEIAIYRKLRRYQMPDHEWRLWHLDQKINDAGIPINLNAVRAAVHLAQATTRKDMAEMKRLTGLANPNSGQQLLPWLRARGYPYLDLKKGHVERAAQAARDEVRQVEEQAAAFPEPMRTYVSRRYGGERRLLLRVLELRARVSKSSVKKYPALLEATDEDGNLRGCHQFAGAGRTWRWSGRRFQPQNLAKPSKAMEKFVVGMAPTHDEDGHKLSSVERSKIGFGMLVHDIEHLTVEQFWEKYEDPEDPGINTMEALVAAVRPMVQAPEGQVLVDADLSAIENVVLGWLADDDKILRVFRLGLDPYIDFAVDMFGMPYEKIAAEVEAGDKTKRTTAKPGVLGCGYMLGAGYAKENYQTGEIEGTGLLGYAWGMGVDLTPEMSELSVKTFRAKFKKVKAFWYELDAACREVIETGQPARVRYLRIDMRGPFMRIRLPSGRFLHYLRPRLERRKMPWKDADGRPVYKAQITYENMENGAWRRVTTHPGKLTENVTQAVARDILAHGMTLADRAGLNLRLHVHDQAVALTPARAGQRALATLIDCLTTLPRWANSKMPLKAAGLTTPVFIKD